MTQSADVLIVGGGIWGLSIAYHLARSKQGSVLLLERNGELAKETTSQSAGQVGQLRADPLLARAVGYTLELLQGFVELTGHDPCFIRSGSLHLSLRPERTTMFRQLRQAARSLDIAVDFVSPDTVSEMAPGVRKAAVDAALHVPGDGFVDARACALAYAAAARDHGCELRTNTEVCSLTRHGSAMRAVTRDATVIETRQLIVAGGPWTSRLVRPLGISPPMYPIRLQQAWTGEAWAIPVDHPVLRVPDVSCYLRPERGGFLYGFFDPQPLPIALEEKPASFATSDVLPEPSLVRESQWRLKEVLPRLEQSPVREYRQGMMTCTPDGRFVIGPAQDFLEPEGPRVWIATGCGGTGIAASGAVGRWLAEWILKGTPEDDLSCYAPDRFGPQMYDLEWLRERACETSAAYYRLASPTGD